MYVTTSYVPGDFTEVPKTTGSLVGSVNSLLEDMYLTSCKPLYGRLITCSSLAKGASSRYDEQLSLRENSLDLGIKFFAGL